MAVAVALRTLAAAHPHATVEQQLHLSLGRDTATLSWLIAPSSEDGEYIFDHVDTDRDGVLSDGERAAFARDLLAATTLEVDGRPVSFVLSDLTVPDRDRVLAGSGLIQATAQADLSLAPGSAFSVTADVAYREFAENWFIQPFYYAGLSGDVLPIVERQEDGLTVLIPADPINGKGRAD